MNLQRIILSSVLLIWSLSSVASQGLVKLNNRSNGLYESMEAAFGKGKSSGDFWIGYNIVKNYENNITIGSYYSDYELGISLRDLINNTTFNKPLNKQRKSEGKRIRIISGRKFDEDIPDKEVAILFKYDRSSTDLADFEEIAVCNLSYYVDLGNVTLFWLGKSDSEESVNSLINIYNTSKTDFAKEKLVAPIGIHSENPVTFKFLKELYIGKNSDDIREDAVFWMGIQKDPKVLEYLKSILQNDKSPDIKEKAVMAIAQNDSEESPDELIYIAKTYPEEKIRKTAITWLGQKAVKKTEEALKDFIENDPDIEIKKRALYALANNPDENISYIIQLANSNKSLQIRKHAIWALSNMDDKRAIDALIDLVNR